LILIVVPLSTTTRRGYKTNITVLDTFTTGTFITIVISRLVQNNYIWIPRNCNARVPWQFFRVIIIFALLTRQHRKTLKLRFYPPIVKQSDRLHTLYTLVVQRAWASLPSSSSSTRCVEILPELLIIVKPDTYYILAGQWITSGITFEITFGKCKSYFRDSIFLCVCTACVRTNETNTIFYYTVVVFSNRPIGCNGVHSKWLYIFTRIYILYIFWQTYWLTINRV